MAQILKDEKNRAVKYGEFDVYGADTGVIKSVNLSKRTITIIGSDESRDRDKDVITVNGWDLENFLNNPVMLYAHNYGGVPIAGATKVIKRKNPSRLEFEEKFPSEGLYPFADMIIGLYNEKILNASSVGFIPRKFVYIDDDGNEIPKEQSTWGSGRRYTQQELLELSACAVPSNPNALQSSFMSRSFGGMLASDIIKQLSGETLPLPQRVDDILEEIYVKRISFIEEDGIIRINVPVSIIDGKVVSDDDEGKEIDKSELEKPFANEHTCRINDPAKYDKFRRSNCKIKKDGKCIDVIFGIKDGTSEMQSLRLNKDIWTAADAKDVCKEFNGTFEAAKFEDADEEFNTVIGKTVIEDVTDTDDEEKDVDTMLKEMKKMMGTMNGKMDKMHGKMDKMMEMMEMMGGGKESYQAMLNEIKIILVELKSNMSGKLIDSKMEDDIYQTILSLKDNKVTVESSSESDVVEKELAPIVASLKELTESLRSVK